MHRSSVCAWVLSGDRRVVFLRACHVVLGMPSVVNVGRFYVSKQGQFCAKGHTVRTASDERQGGSKHVLNDKNKTKIPRTTCCHDRGFTI